MSRCCRVAVPVLRHNPAVPRRSLLRKKTASIFSSSSGMSQSEKDLVSAIIISVDGLWQNRDGIALLAGETAARAGGRSCRRLTFTANANIGRFNWSKGLTQEYVTVTQGVDTSPSGRRDDVGPKRKGLGLPRVWIAVRQVEHPTSTPSCRAASDRTPTGGS
jgi:hypothetical protein